MRPLSVLFVLDTWGLIGGTERYAAVVVPALLERGHRVTVLCREDQRPGFADVEVLVHPELGGTRLAGEARRELYRDLHALAPDVTYLSTLGNLDALELLTHVAPSVRFVHDHTLFCPGLNKVHENGDNCRDPFGTVCLRRYYFDEGCICFKPARFEHTFADPIRDLRLKWREFEVARSSTRVLTNSDYMRQELILAGMPPERTSVLYYFTQSNTPAQPRGPLDPATEAFLAASDAPLVFTPARLVHPDKGVDYLLTALGEVDHAYRAVVAGSGPAEPWLREKTRLEGLEDRVHFSGWTPSPAIETLYSRADVVVFPSVWNEPFGLVGIEAMSHGKPVVAFGVGGVPEWLDDGRTGHLIERQDTHGLARAIQGLLDDPARGAAMGAEGRRVVAERFGRDAHVAGLEAALAEAAG